MQSYINQINEIKNINWNDVNFIPDKNFEGFDVESAKLYAKALDGVEASQASLLLSTQGLTNSEIQRVLAQQNLTKEQQYTALSTAGLLKSTQSLTIAELQETLQSQLGSKAKAEETLKSMGLSVAIEGEEQQTVELTGKKIQLAIASGQLTKAQAAELAMHLGIDKALDAQNTSALPHWLSNLKSTGTALKKQAVETLNWAKALPLATKALAGVGIGVGVALVAFSAYRKHLENIRLETEESANAYQESSSSIDDYISRYDELQTALKNAKGNEEETLAVKQQLLGLQTELNEKYGDEYGKINLVTDAYNNQTDALKKLKLEEANRFLNENKKGIDRAEKQMEKERNYTLSTSGINSNTADGQELQKLVEKYSDKGMYMLDSGDGTFQIHLKANADEAYDVINDFESDVRDLEDEFSNKYLFDNIINFSSASLNDAKSVIDKYGEIYNQAQMANLVNDKNASPIYEKALSAVEEYNKALLESEDPFNDETVAKAKANVEAVKAEANALGEYGTIFGDVFEQADTRLLDFNEEFKNNDTLQEFAEKLRGKSVVDIKSMENDGQQDAFDSLINYANEFDISTNELINTLIRLGYVQDDVSDSTNDMAEKVSLSKSEMINTINSMSDGMDVLDDIYADILDEGTFDFTKLDTSKFSDAFIGLEPQYEKFIETVSAFPDDIDKCQEAFNELTTAYIEQKGILSGVSEENKQLTADMLENMGIANAEEVVMSALGLSFEDYATAKRECASAGVNLITATDTEIERLINMKLVSEETAQALFYYQLQKALSNENCLDTSADCANLIMLAQNAGVTGGVLDDLIELEQIQKQLESGGIISEHMLSKLMARAEELNASIKSQSTQFQTTVKPISQYTGAGKTADAMNKKLKDSTDAVTEAMKKEKEALERTKSKIEKKKQYYEDVAEAIDWFYDKQIDKQQKAIDKLEKENELLEERIDYYNGALSAIDRYYEKQIDNLEKQKDALAGNNKEAEIALNLEKRQQELQEAKSRKSISLYQKGKGFVHTTDTSAIKEAEENLAEAQRQKDEADIDAKINKLQEYRDLWAEIPSIKQKSEEDSQMIQLLGAEWESILLEGRISNFTSFKDQYVSLQQQVDNNESMIKSYEEKIAYYESLKLEWDNLLAKYQEDTYTQLLIGAFGNDFENELLNGRTGRWVQFAEDYYNIQVELKDVTDQIEALTARMEEYASRIESAANDAVAAVKKLKEAEAEAKSSKGWYTGGWTSAIKPSGKAKGGIITKNDAGDLDFVAKSVGEDHMVALTEGEAVIPKKSVEQNKDIIRELIATSSKIERFEPNIPDSFDSLKSIGAIPQFNYRIPRGNHSISQVRNENINISIGDIHVHGVQDVNGLSDAIIKEMPNMVIQKINKRR